MEVTHPFGEFIVDFEPQEFQEEGVDFIAKWRRVLIPLPTGTGKTYVALKGAHRIAAKRIIVLCSGNALYTWRKNIRKHMPKADNRTAIISKMTLVQRQAIYKDTEGVDIIVMRFKTFAYDHKLLEHIPFDLVIADECHKFMRNHKSDQFNECIVPLCKRVPNLIFLSATPVSKGRQQIYPLLHVCRPHRFKSYWAFVNTYLIVMRGAFAVELLGPKNTLKFREVTKDIAFIPKSPIKGLPQVIRSTLVVEMTEDQRDFYNRLRDDMYIRLNSGEILLTSNILATCTRLRQVLCCPAILDPHLGYGGGVEGVLDHMEEGEEERQHCVWFTPFTDAIPYFKQALQGAGFEKIVTFQSGMGLEELEDAEERFRADREYKAIVSIKYAQSFELETGFPAYFIGYDWDPYENSQGEGRLARLTSQRKSIPAYYVHHLGTYDDRLLEVNGTKVSNTKVDMESIQVLKTLFDPKETN